MVCPVTIAFAPVAWTFARSPHALVITHVDASDEDTANCRARHHSSHLTLLAHARATRGDVCVDLPQCRRKAAHVRCGDAVACAAASSVVSLRLSRLRNARLGPSVSHVLTLARRRPPPRCMYCALRSLIVSLASRRGARWSVGCVCADRDRRVLRAWLSGQCAAHGHVCCRSECAERAPTQARYGSSTSFHSLSLDSTARGPGSAAGGARALSRLVSLSYIVSPQHSPPPASTTSRFTALAESRLAERAPPLETLYV